MRSLSWNCRGVNSENSTTIPYISDLRSKFSKFGCTGSMGVDALNFNGGLFVAWFSTSMLVKVEECTKNFILCNISDGPYFYYLCFLYGAPKIEHREEVWEALNDKFSSRQGPLIMIGDFNQMEFADQKSGGSIYIPGEKKFTEWRIGNGLTELPSHGPAFMWCNNRRGGELIHEQLNQAYCNED
ncbi:Gamma-glutamyl phosphate reductase [Bienertia sinuspersici]